MHAAGMRRVPAERAHHPKRLGHAGVVLAAAPSTTTTQGPILPVTTSQTPTPSSTAHPSSSAPPSTSTSSTSPTPTSASPPSSSPVASSAGTQSLSSPTLASSTGTLPGILTPSFPTSSPSSTPSAHAAAQNSGLSGGAIAGIIAGGAIVGAALIVFIIRKTYLRRRRERNRISWTAAPGLGATAGNTDEPKPFTDVAERVSFSAITPQRNVPPSPFVPHGQSMYTAPVSPLAHMPPPGIPPYAVPSPPPGTYNNPAPMVAYPAHPAYGPGTPPPRAQHAPMDATVRCTFVPTLPDELSITTGERVFVLERYDDGWDLCSNARGERGMVPRECLEQAPADQPDAGWRNVGRASSLNPDGGRY